MTLPYEPALLIPGFLLSDIFIAQLDEETGVWEPLTACFVDPSATTVTCTADHLSTFAVFADVAQWRDLEDGSRYFAATNTYLRGEYVEFYDRTGGVARHGLPRTNAGIENGTSTQWFQRTRLEAGPGGAVRWTEMGTEIADGLGLEWEPETVDECTLRNTQPPLTEGLEPEGGLGPVVVSLADEFLRAVLLVLPDGAAGGEVAEHSQFGETDYCVSGPFLTYFQANGGTAVFGLPISPEFVDPGDGIVRQFFERAVFEREAGSTGVALALVADRLLQAQGRLR